METGSTSQEINQLTKATLSSDKCIRTGGRPFSCDNCAASFRSYRGLTQHKKRHIRKMETDSTPREKNTLTKATLSFDKCIRKGGKPFSCHSCAISFRSYRGLTQHKERSYSCSSGLAQHKKRNIRKTETESTSHEKNPLTKDPLSFDRYIRKGGKPFSCDRCAISFRSIQGLMQHKEGSFSCSSGLSQDEKLPTDKRQITCDECGKCFPSRSDLSEHKKNHIKRRKEYSCSVCGNSYQRKCSHIVVKKPSHNDWSKVFKSSHTVVKKPSDNDWSKVFVDILGLLKPIELHTSGALFSCTVCGLRFSIKSMLLSHEKVHTFEKPSRHDDTEFLTENDGLSNQQSTLGGEEIPLVNDHLSLDVPQWQKSKSKNNFNYVEISPKESLGDLSGEEEVIIKEEIDALEELSDKVVEDPLEELPVKVEIDPLQIFIKEENNPLEEISM